MEANSAVSRADGVTDAELAALADPASSALFDEREQAALAYAEAITLSNSVADGVFERVRRHFSEEEIIELTATVTWEICAAKFNRALEIEAQGICLLPPDPPDRPTARHIPLTPATYGRIVKLEPEAVFPAVYPLL